jgi:hypothetical protein
MRPIIAALSGLVFVLGADCQLINKFLYEAIQLTTKNFRSLSTINPSHGTISTRVDTSPECKAFPGDVDWPPASEWAVLNASVGGRLLNPLPPAVVCYPGPNRDANRCNFLLNTAGNSRFFIDDPVTVLGQWPQGNTCLVSANVMGNCTQGGFPVYVVNVTSVSDVQAAVNFARTKNVRLIIK